ncbi:hypothetical protein [Sphingomonas palmae]|nr:hypothetical protein [Sphingomonas palmae]
MWIAAAAALMGAAPAVPTVAAGEIVLPRADARFVLHETTARPGGQLSEYRRSDEPAEKWTRAVALTRQLFYPGTSEKIRADAPALASLVAAISGSAIQSSCSGATVKVTRADPSDQFAAATLRVRCPREAITHDPMLTYVRVIVAQEAIHSVTAMVRGEATRADVEWADRVISDLTLCNAGDVAGRCAARSRVIGAPL